VREAVKEHVSRAIEGLDPRGFRQEPAHVSALLGRLAGAAYDGPDGSVIITVTNIDSIGPGAAERWSGADLAITASISDGNELIRKAILSQAKLGAVATLEPGERERLDGQIKDMQRIVPNPKVLEIPADGLHRRPRMLSGNKVLDGDYTGGYDLPDYFVRRILTTFDGVTDPVIVEGVQDSNLRQLRLNARFARRVV
jgi:hypothetical protein